MDPKRFIKLYGKNFVKNIINESPPSSTLVYYDDIECNVWYYKDNGYQAYNSILKSWSFIFDPQEPLPLSTKDHLVDLCELKWLLLKYNKILKRYNMNFEEFLLNESINDKGILKAIFVVGLPGAGKSYTISNLKGQISPKIVNTDVALEFLSKKTNIPANSETWKTVFRDSTKKMTSTMLYNYINGMLPLFIDGTSNDTSNVLSRAGILESLGYDVGMIFIDTDIEVAKQRAIERAEKIGRTVDPSFIDKVYQESEDNKNYFKSKFDFFKIYENNGQSLDNDLMNKLFKEVQSFYNEDIINPVGKRNLIKIEEGKEKYLVPTIFNDETLKSKLSTWYKT